MKITRQADYAVRVVAYLASQPQGRIVTSDEVSREKLVPKSFTAKIFQRLCKACITESKRGIRGGFVLGRKLRDISILDVVEAIDGPITVNYCVVDEDHCPLSDHCAIHPIWVDIHSEIIRRLKSANFQNLINPADS